ncbi:hypothetical protein [Promicromonospora sp. NPDC050249]|uniref:hypothetical protein n=1 Tax=Promicromonospora sp. NPDC050249 TaxID=3154743 RepID=UPI0033F369C0
MRTSRLVSLMIALVAAIIWVVSTYANASNSWDPLNFVLRIAAGAVTIAAAAEWLVLSVRESRRERFRDGRTTGVHAGGSRGKARHGVQAAPGPELVAHSPEPAAPSPEPAPPGPEPVAPRPEPVVPSRTAAVRRSAGSGTMADKLLSVFGRRRSPAQDLAAVAAGGAVLVVAYLMERKVRRVVVRVGLDAASVDSVESVLGAAPHRVFGTQQPTRGLFARSAFTQVDGASGAGAWSIAVPTADVDLLRYVLARAEEVR